METGCIVTPLGREWARPLHALGVQCQLKSSASRWTQVRYIHTAATHALLYFTMGWHIPQISPCYGDGNLTVI